MNENGSGEPVDPKGPTALDPSAQAEGAEMRELEFLGLKRELDVRIAYTDHLARLLDDQARQVEWLREHFEHYRAHVDHVARLLESEQRRADAQIEAERISASDMRAVLERRLSDVERELAAERARASYRMVQAVLRIVQHRKLRPRKSTARPDQAAAGGSEIDTRSS